MDSSALVQHASGAAPGEQRDVDQGLVEHAFAAHLPSEPGDVDAVVADALDVGWSA
jgi:hypothetical protein